MAVFLSQSWFEEVDKLSQQAGELNLPPSHASVLMNVKVIGDDVVNMNFANGYLSQGLLDNALSTVLLDRLTLQSLLKDFDMNEAMSAFINGQIRVEGDMSQLMALQSTRPSDEQKALFKKIQKMTEFE